MNPEVLYDVSTERCVDKPIKALHFYPPCAKMFQDGELKLVEMVEESVETVKDAYRSSNATTMEGESLVHHHENLFDGVISARNENEQFPLNAEALARTRAAKRDAKTPLGRRLMEIRERAIMSGVVLLGREDIEREVIERRGGVQ